MAAPDANSSRISSIASATSQLSHAAASLIGRGTRLASSGACAVTAHAVYAVAQQAVRGRAAGLTEVGRLCHAASIARTQLPGSAKLVAARAILPTPHRELAGPRPTLSVGGARRPWRKQAATAPLTELTSVTACDGLRNLYAHAKAVDATRLAHATARALAAHVGATGAARALSVDVALAAVSSPRIDATASVIAAGLGGCLGPSACAKLPRRHSGREAIVSRLALAQGQAAVRRDDVRIPNALSRRGTRDLSTRRIVCRHEIANPHVRALLADPLARAIATDAIDAEARVALTRFRAGCARSPRSSACIASTVHGTATILHGWIQRPRGLIGCEGALLATARQPRGDNPQGKRDQAPSSERAG